MGHTDVVPVEGSTENKWSHSPFSGDIADSLIWGRGAADDKCAVISILEAVEDLLRQNYQPERTIYLSFGSDEEILLLQKSAMRCAGATNFPPPAMKAFLSTAC